MTKTYRRRDRTWRECISLEDFQRIAREVVGRDRPNKETDDWCKNLFGNVTSPGVKDPLRRKQREEAILANLERVERGHHDGGHKNRDHNSKKRKRVVDSSSGLPEDRRSYHRESTYSENVGRVVEGSPLRAVLAQQRGSVSPVSFVTPTRPRLPRPLGPMTNFGVMNSTTPPKSPLDGNDHSWLEFSGVGKGERSKARLSSSPDPFVGDERDGRDSLNINPFTLPSPVPQLPPPTITVLRRMRMDHQGDANPHSIPSTSQVNINAQLTAKTAILPVPQINVERHSQSIAGSSLPTPMSNEPTKRVLPLVDSLTIIEADVPSIGAKRAREEEDVSSPSKKISLAKPSPSVQKVPSSSHNSKPSEIWSPDETTFIMEDPPSTRGASRSKTPKGNMSVDAIKARLIRATSTLQIIPSEKPDRTVSDPAVVVGVCDTKSTRTEERITREKTIEDGVEPVRQKAGLLIPTFGIPAPFPPGTSGPGLPLERANNSDRVAAYHGADKFYSSRPPSATPQRQPEVLQSTSEDKKSSARALVDDTKQGVSTKQSKPEDSRMTLGRFPSFVLGPQQLLFTDTVVGTLMSTSVVWFARGIRDPEPTHRPSSLQLVPRMNEVSQLESLLVACGWHVKKAFTSKRGIDRGVVFVDYEEQTDVHAVIKTHWVAQQCENAYRLATQYQTTVERGMRPIWIMDAEVLRWEGLRLMRPGDSLDTLEKFVLWKKV